MTSAVRSPASTRYGFFPESPTARIAHDVLCGLMTIRREPVPNGICLVTSSARVDITKPSPHLLLIKMVGEITNELTDDIRDRIAEAIHEGGPFEMFIDQYEANSVSTTFRKKIVGFLSRVPDRVTKLHVLSTNPLLPMLV